METAFMKVHDGQQQAFLAALDDAKQVLAQAKGFRTLHVHQGIERPTTMMLAIGWDTLEDHTIGFRESDLFTQWRAILGPFFAEAPHVEHWTLFED